MSDKKEALRIARNIADGVDFKLTARHTKLLARPVGSSSFSYEFAQKINAILDALVTFHPMHGESWKGWPK